MIKAGFIFTASLILCSTLLVAAPADDTKGDVNKGKQVFEQCAVCHNVDSPDRKMGPSLQGLYKHKTMAGGKPVNDANVLSQINNGGNGMPGYADMLSAQDKADLLAYLHTL